VNRPVSVVRFTNGRRVVDGDWVRIESHASLTAVGGYPVFGYTLMAMSVTVKGIGARRAIFYVGRDIVRCATQHETLLDPARLHQTYHLTAVEQRSVDSTFTSPVNVLDCGALVSGAGRRRGETPARSCTGCTYLIWPHSGLLRSFDVAPLGALAPTLGGFCEEADRGGRGRCRGRNCPRRFVVSVVKARRSARWLIAMVCASAHGASGDRRCDAAGPRPCRCAVPQELHHGPDPQEPLRRSHQVRCVVVLECRRGDRRRHPGAGQRGDPAPYSSLRQ
jgi:hypothetical protein